MYQTSVVVFALSTEQNAWVNSSTHYVKDSF